MHPGASNPQQPRATAPLEGLLKHLPEADAEAIQVEVDRLIESALSAARLAHQQDLRDAHQSHQQSMREAHEAYQQHIQSLFEHIRLARQRLFGRSSEAHAGQQRLQFDEAEQTAHDSTAAEDQSLIPATDVPGSVVDATPQNSERSVPRKRGKRTPIPPHLTRVPVVIDVPASQRVCPCCGKTMVEIGEDISEQLDVIPMRVQVLEFHRKRYGCPTREHAPIIAERPPQVLPKSNASNDLLALLITAKYVDGLPLARMEYILGRAGALVPRVTLARWMIQAAEKLKPLEAAMNPVLTQYPVLQIDETPVQVLKEKDRSPSTQSYMWVRKGGPPECPIILYHYAPSRGKAVPMDLLKDWQGYLMCDGFGAYDAVGHRPGVELLACWAHARRGFVDAIKLQPKGKAGRANEMVKMIAELYQVEKAQRTASVEERFRARQTLSQPILQTIRAWLDRHIPITAPKSALGKAMAYLDKYWPRLIRYTERGDLPMDNNATERAIRPFAIGRRAWLFSDTPAGAEASARLYSLVETAKANGLEPYTWLLKVMRGLPEATKSGNWEPLMPWNLKAEDLITDAYGSKVPTS